jgi:hypothetical protein
MRLSFQNFPDSLDRIDAGVLPPGSFIVYAVHQSMMVSGTANSSLACDQGPRLQVAHVMGVGWLAATEEAGLLGNVTKVAFFAITAGSGNR